MFHCSARLADEVEFIYRYEEQEAGAMAECVDLLFTQPLRPMQDSGKASGKGTPFRVPALGEEDGPEWVEEGWVFGYKLWVGDLPSDISKIDIGPYCYGQVDISVQCHRARSGMAYAIITFTEQAEAIKAFEELSMAKFVHDNGTCLRPVVKWFRCVKPCPSHGERADEQDLPLEQI